MIDALIRQSSVVEYHLCISTMIRVSSTTAEMRLKCGYAAVYDDSSIMRADADDVYIYILLRGHYSSSMCAYGRRKLTYM